jgi:hypothetical protein
MAFGLWKVLEVEGIDIDTPLPSAVEDSEEFNRFLLTGVEKTVSRDNRITTAIYADKILDRNRRSASIVFYNLNEIYIDNLRLKLDASGARPLELLFSDIPYLAFPKVGDGSFNSTGKGLASGSVEHYLVTRIVVDGFNMKVTFSAGRVAVISGDSAILRTRDQNIVLEGNVAIQDAEGRRLSAPQAIWSKQHEGVLFPQGYSEEHSNQIKKYNIGFFEIDPDGTLTETGRIPVFQAHQDLVDQLENLLWAHLFRKLFGGFQ